MVDQEVAFGHVLWHTQSIDQAGNQFAVSDGLSQVLELGPDAVEVCQVASKGVARLDGAVLLCLEALGMVQRIVLVGI